MIYHFIRFRFGSEASEEHIERITSALESLKAHPAPSQVIVGRIEDAHVLVKGKNVGDPNGGYTHAVLMIFDGEDAYERYVTSQEFRDNRESGVPLAEKVAGFDFIDDWDAGTPDRIRAIRAKRTKLETED